MQIKLTINVGFLFLEGKHGITTHLNPIQR